MLFINVGLEKKVVPLVWTLKCVKKFISALKTANGLQNKNVFMLIMLLSCVSHKKIIVSEV